MGTAVSIDISANGGFPQPLKGEPLRVVAARHDACGTRTEVQIPRSVPARAVRRVHCATCDVDFEADSVREIGLRAVPALRGLRRPSMPSLSRPSMPKLPSLSRPSFPSRPSVPSFDPSSRLWRAASVPIAAALVIGGLLLIQGGDDSIYSAAPPPVISQPTAANVTPAPPPPTGRELDQRADKPSKHTELIQGSSFHFALPSKWERVEPPSGATFTATAPGGEADATLWIEEDPGLAFDDFVNRSRKQLEGLAGSAHEVERVAGPTPEESLVRLAADAPPGQPTYEVLLRSSGPYRYYLATTVEPGASPEAREGVELITGSFSPEGGV